MFRPRPSAKDRLSEPWPEGAWPRGVVIAAAFPLWAVTRMARFVALAGFGREATPCIVKTTRFAGATGLVRRGAARALACRARRARPEGGFQTGDDVRGDRLFGVTLNVTQLGKIVGRGERDGDALPGARCLAR